MKKIELTIYELCEEVDYWKAKAFEWESDFNDLKQKYNDLQSSSLSHAQAMAGNQLKLIFAMVPRQLATAFDETPPKAE